MVGEVEFIEALERKYGQKLKTGKFPDLEIDQKGRAVDNLVADLGGEDDQFCILNFEDDVFTEVFPNCSEQRRSYILSEAAALMVTGRMTGKDAARKQKLIAQAFVEMKRVIKNQRLHDDRQLRLQLEAVQEKANTLETILEAKANTLAKLLNIAPSKTREHFQRLVDAGVVTAHTKEIHGFYYKPTDKGLDYVQHVDKNGIIHWKESVLEFLK